MILKNDVPERWDVEVDLVAMGASSGGLAAVIKGHDMGLKTLLLEKSDYLGGGTALSGGVLWVPFNDHMAEAGLEDSKEEALLHIRSTSMGRHDEDLLDAFLDPGPEAVRYLEEHTPLKMTIEASPDYYADLPGGKKRGRQIYPDPEVMDPLLTEAEKTHALVAKVRPDPIPFFLGARKPWSEGRGLIGGLTMGCVERGIEVLTNVRGCRVAIGSNAEAGSSIRIISGRTAIARAMQRRCCSPTRQRPEDHGLVPFRRTAWYRTP